MSAVFDRYPVGGGEFTLALALADHAHDDGRKVFPYVASLAAKTRQSERTVQRQLVRMQEAGWLIAVGAGNGGRGRATEYRISPEWLAGGEPIRPSDSAPKGDNLSPFPGPSPDPERVTNGAEKGDTAVSPAIEPQEPSLLNTPPSPPRGAKGPLAKPGRCAEAPKRKATPIGLKAWLLQCAARGERPIPPGDPVFAYCEQVGIGGDVLALHWREFKLRRGDGAKRQRDWRQTFRNSVRGNWFRLWFLKPGFEAQLTTVGLQAQALLDAERTAEQRVSSCDAADDAPHRRRQPAAVAGAAPA